MEYIDNKSIAGNRTLQYNYAVPLGEMFIHLGRKQSVLAHARGTHSLYGKKYTDDDHTMEDVGNILLRNKTEKITFNEFLKVLYYYSNEKLVYWNSDTGRLIWFVRQPKTDNRLHFIIYDAVNNMQYDYDSSAGIELSNLVFFPWDESHFIAANNSTCEIFKWDFVNQTTEYITKLPSTKHYVFRILDDNTLVAALEEWNTGDIWFYRQSSDTLSKISEGSDDKHPQDAAIAIGEDTFAMIEPYKCKYYSFQEVP